MTGKPIVFLAPGAGLGHIVRVSAIACALAEEKTPSLILTTSKWAEALSRITSVPTVTITMDCWDKKIYQYLSTIETSVIVQDTFPFGFRSESLKSFAKKKQFVYLARYLKTDAYFNRLNKKWDKASPLLSTIIEIEPLERYHRELISETQSQHFKLERRICFPSEKFIQKIPERLQTTLSSKKTHLIVHSGPLHETQRLLELAEEQIKNKETEKIAIISPLFAEMKKNNSFDYFPAAVLFPKAFKIFTGGGYNSIAETECFRNKTTYLPFPRHYDDQQARIEEIREKQTASEKNKSGAKQAAEIILSLQ